MTIKSRCGRLTTLALTLAILSTAATAQLSLTTNFTGNTGQQGNMFEVKSLVGVTITGFDVHFTGTSDFEIWTLNTPGTYLGDVSSNANWTLQGSSPGLVSLGMNTPTPFGVPVTINIPAGVVQSIYVTAAPTGGSATVWYNSGVSQGSLHAANTDMEIYVGNSGSYFSNTIVGRGWNGTIYYQLASTFTDDLAVTSIPSPNDSVGCETLTAAEAVQATFTNYGSNTILVGSLVQLDLVVDAGPTVTEFALLPADLLQGQSYTHSFAATADLSTFGSHTVDVTVVQPGDMNPANDTKSKTVNSGGFSSVTSYPWFENFDSAAAQNSTVPPAGWTQDTADATGADADWYMHYGTTGSTNTGPPSDHTSGINGIGHYYAYVEDSSGSHSQVNLDSPCLDLSGLSSPICNFYMHSFNATSPTTTNENFLSVDVISYPGGTVSMDAIGPIGHQATATSWSASTWTAQSINLSPFVGQVIQLRFRGRSDGGSFTHDIAIDDVSVLDPQPTPGQAPQPGLATLDINGALNTNAAPVGLGLGGPFYGAVDVGSLMAIEIVGEINAPIALLAGPLTPVAATYPNIGQLDIGGAVNPMTGVPINIVVIGDGFNPFTFIDAIFNTGPAGQLNLGLQIPSLPSGVLGTFQSLLGTNNGFFFAISNAVEVTIN